MHNYIFMHGLGCSPRSFDTISWELWKAGHSVSSVTSFFLPKKIDAQIANFDEIAEPFVEQFRSMPNIIVVAHSMGSAVALPFCEALEGNIHGLCLIEGNLFEDDCGELSDMMSANETGDYPSSFYRNILSLKEELGWMDWLVDHQQYTPETLAKYAKSLVKISRDGTLNQRYSRLTCQKLFLHGDSYIEGGKRLAVKNLPEEERVHVFGTGHFIMSDSPRECANLIANHFDQTVQRN